MFCTKCGAELMDGARFCIACGSQVFVPEDEAKQPYQQQGQPYQQAYQPQVPSQPSASQGAPKTTFILIGAIAAALVIIGILAFVLLSPGGDKASTASASASSAAASAQSASAQASGATASGSAAASTVSNGSANTSSNQAAPASSANAAPAQVGQSPAPANNANASGDYVLSDSATRYYSRSELERMDLHNLYLARNEIYARHGRGFKNQDLQSYFNSKNWYVYRYSPEQFDSMASPLNSYEYENANLMLEVEKARNSPYI